MPQKQWPGGIETSQHDEVIISELVGDPEYRATYEDLIAMHRDNGNDQHANRMEELMAAADARQGALTRTTPHRNSQQQTTPTAMELGT